MLIGQPATVIGAGIAGLAAARALALRGARVRLVERAAALGEVGGGLQVAPNGMAVVEALGLAGAARAASVRASAVELIDGLSGRRVARLDLERFAPDLEWRLFHRADLVAMLASGAEAAGVTLDLGTEAEPDLDGLVLGADGFASRMRVALNGAGTPVFTGQVAWRATLPWDGPATTEIRVFLGPGCHLVTYPLRGGRLRNIVAVEERREWAAEGWALRDDPANLQAAFASFEGGVREMLAGVEDVHLWGLFRHPVAPRWQDGRRAILGDAAHPTLPFLAQGANMGLEDAWVLAEELSRLPAAEALVRYQARRVPRVRRIVAAADANARAYHLRGLPRYAAHRLLRLADLVAPRLALSRFDWLYRHDVTRG
jgi:salicylate hydroxylase